MGLIPPLTIRHRVDLGPAGEHVGDDLLRPEAWDHLRLHSETGPYALAASAGDLGTTARAHPEIGERMRLLDARLARDRVGTLVSYGVGAAVPEAWLSLLRPDRRMVLTDYAPGTVRRLGELFPQPEVDVVAHDLQREAPLAGDVHLFHRIDTELSDAQWTAVFQRFAEAHVIVVATELLGPARLTHEARMLIRRAPRIEAGWVRNRAAFEQLWAPTHMAEPLGLGDLAAWSLSPRSARSA